MSEQIGIDQAATEMGLKLPVKVELHPNLGQAVGRYLGVIGGSHRIALHVGRKTKVPKLGTTICLPGRSSTIWHELTHARQCEREHGGNSSQFFHHYKGELSKALGVPKDDLLTGTLHVRVQRELRASGGDFSTTLHAYRSTRFEAEAHAVAERLGHIDVVFPVSRKTRRDAL